MPCFRPNTNDVPIWEGVYCLNEYRTPDEFPLGALVLDVGGHIGSFAKMCAERGALVESYEPNVESCEIYRKNLEHTPNCLLIHKAISSCVSTRQLYHRPGGDRAGDSLEIDPGNGKVESCETISLEDAIAQRQVHWLKVDAEHSEYPIFLVLPKIRQWVHRITVESHKSARHDELKALIVGLGYRHRWSAPPTPPIGHLGMKIMDFEVEA